VRFGGEALYVCEQLGRHSELGELDRTAAAIEEAEDDALAEHRRYSGDAEIELARFEAHSDAAVLWAPALGDVELGEELDAGDDRVVVVGRWF
jgi:hypothetical protein